MVESRTIFAAVAIVVIPIETKFHLIVVTLVDSNSYVIMKLLHV